MITVYVCSRDSNYDTLTSEIKESLHGKFAFDEITAARVYLLDLLFAEKDSMDRIRDILADSPVETISIHTLGSSSLKKFFVFRKPGVMDPVEESVVIAGKKAGLPVDRVRCGTAILLKTSEKEDRIRSAIFATIANPVVDQVIVGEEGLSAAFIGKRYEFKLNSVPIGSADDDELRKISDTLFLSLNLSEMKAIRAHFKSLGREPTDVELESIAQTWSEHCKHKTITASVRKGGKEYKNLLKETVFAATMELAKPYCLSVFEDNAGIIEFVGNHCLAAKVETHNHPSAIEPYGGSNTGLGGVIRDILGCGLGAKPVANIDVFCVATPEFSDSNLPSGTLNPVRLLKGVVAGVRDYGNRMGIPTVAGAVYFDDGFICNPLVYCGTIGVIPKENILKKSIPGDSIILIGGRTGRDGIHGATFSSAALTEDSDSTSREAVQIGNAITEKKVLDAVLEARDLDLFDCVTDCGAGGLSSAIGEMGKDTGAVVHLDRVPLKYEGLSYTEIWISESQERMVLSVPEGKVEETLALMKKHSVEATLIGKFSDNKKLTLLFDGTKVGELDMQFLHDGLPKRTYTVSAKPHSDVEGIPPDTQMMERTELFNKVAKEKSEPGKQVSILRAFEIVATDWNVASKEWIVRQYDHEVQGGSIVKPFCGAHKNAPSDGVVVRPLGTDGKGFAIGLGLCPRYALCPADGSAAHAREMTLCAIDEAIRNVVAAGANPAQIALLDNFCWGDTNDTAQMSALVDSCEACYEGALGYSAPFISGKDSLNNFYVAGGKKISIPPTLLITAIGVLDASKAVTADGKNAGDLIYAVGSTGKHLGRSVLYERLKAETGVVPCPDIQKSSRTFKAIHLAIGAGLVRACHDVSDGGIATSLGEMCMGGKLGCRFDISQVPVESKLNSVETLFSETPGRFLVSIHPGARRAFENIMRDISCKFVGVFTWEEEISIEFGKNRLATIPLPVFSKWWHRLFPR